MAEDAKDLITEYENARPKDPIAEYEGSALKVKLDDRGSAVVLRLDGRLTMGGASILFGDIVRDLRGKAGLKKIVVDLSGVTYIDSTGIAELVSAFTRSKNAGIELVLAGLQKKVQDLMQITKLYTIWNIFPTAEDALSAS
jgi:anti-sigma B factor antagonist